ncbi:aminotransferase class I/II-fold pyridoxal phosphate-dependent enzyme [Peribacillus sp. FSL E2-0159]|uniref:aminotransferase class I/II-fold pyridoxal phosphate-dependent enzyme n=1 Tax=Peribacillus sp. FSL E2-0159 TaxID=2975289 RepID=UPI00315A3B79
MTIEKESPEELGYEKIKYNLSESSIADRRFADLDFTFENLTIFYGDHSGKKELREIIAQEHYNMEADQVFITNGACAALFIIHSTLLNPGDHILVVKPNYATNIEVPRSLGITTNLQNLNFENNFEVDTDELKSLMTPETKIISITYPHNPTGVMISEAKLNELIEIAEEHGCYLVVDETYRDLTIGEKLPTAASLSSKAISVESLSKAYGLPGIRMGWLTTRDKDLKEAFLATKEQISICNSVFDEEIAYHVFKNRDRFLESTRADNLLKFNIVKQWMNEQDYIEWVEPQGGVICFPRIKSDVNIDTNEFYKVLFEKYGTLVGAGRWFEMSDRHFRIGYAWPTVEQLKGGLESIIKTIEGLKE